MSALPKVLVASESHSAAIGRNQSTVKDRAGPFASVQGWITTGKEPQSAQMACPRPETIWVMSLQPAFACFAVSHGLLRCDASVPWPLEKIARRDGAAGAIIRKSPRATVICTASSTDGSVIQKQSSLSSSAWPRRRQKPPFRFRPTSTDFEPAIRSAKLPGR